MLLVLGNYSLVLGFSSSLHSARYYFLCSGDNTVWWVSLFADFFSFRGWICSFTETDLEVPDPVCLGRAATCLPSGVPAPSYLFLFTDLGSQYLACLMRPWSGHTSVVKKYVSHTGYLPTSALSALEGTFWTTIVRYSTVRPRMRAFGALNGEIFCQRKGETCPERIFSHLPCFSLNDSILCIHAGLSRFCFS